MHILPYNLLLTFLRKQVSSICHFVADEICFFFIINLELYKKKTEIRGFLFKTNSTVSNPTSLLK